MSRNCLSSRMAALLSVLAAVLILQVQTQGQDKSPDFSGKTIKKGQFGKKDWKGANFQKATLDNCNFTEAKLPGADFRNAKIISGYLSYADLTGADFRGAVLSKDNSGLGSDWVGCVGTNLTKANLEGADLSGCAFTQASFRGANLRNLKGIAQANASDFTGADLSGADLSKMTWTAASAEPKFKNAIYDDKTKWPVSVTDPKELGAIKAGEQAKAGKGIKGE